MIVREVALIGTARPRPTPATAVLIPTTRARESASAPPELPGLRAASVWMTSSTRPGRPTGAGRQRPAEAADHARGHRAAQAERAAHRDHQLADDQVVGLAQRGGAWRFTIGAHHRQVRQRIGAHDTERRARPVGEQRGAVVGAAHDVGVGQQEPIGGVDHRRAQALTAVAAGRIGHAQAGHLRGQLGRHPGHDLRVHVEGFVSCHIALHSVVPPLGLQHYNWKSRPASSAAPGLCPLGAGPSQGVAPGGGSRYPDFTNRLVEGGL